MTHDHLHNLEPGDDMAAILQGNDRDAYREGRKLAEGVHP
jgi:hypothetical protein